MRGAPGDEVGGAWNDGSWFHATGIGRTRLWLQRKVHRSGISGAHFPNSGANPQVWLSESAENRGC